MILVIGILVMGFLIALFEIPGLVKKKLWGELVAFCVLLTVGVALAVYLTF
ncbi:MAG: hypothetical protein AB1420_15500 [Bacillota bacterium]